MGVVGHPFQTADGSKILWYPALRVGQLYAAFAAEAGTLMGVPTGLTDNERLGGTDVDVAVFQQFTQALYDRHRRSNHFVLHGLLRGVLLPSIVMLENGGGSITRTLQGEAGLFDDHDTYKRGM
ncbi:DUF6086 family protein [Kitasatospora phosalacinea]|uniref:DUF6086 family protein n=1 Tax=Kitasatospora phosalacinea TaxID=2065 RepID=UPI00131B77D1|nr:DUF6086 family protein [Kitasatospora phosalacinea]